MVLAIVVAMIVERMQQVHAGSEDELRRQINAHEKDVANALVQSWMIADVNNDGELDYNVILKIPIF